MEDFTPADAGAVATAADDARAEAEKRREKMSTSAAAFDHRAEGLLGVLKKILDRLPERFHDAGGTFDYSGDKGVKWRLFRYTDVVQNQARALRKRWLLSNFSGVNPDGSRLLRGTYWSTSSARESYTTGDTEGYSKELAESTIARVRTDLDTFSEGETAVLENHGYLLADIAIQVHVPELYPEKPLPLRAPHKDWMDEEKVRKALARQ